MIAFKVLGADRQSMYGRGRWTPGRWRLVRSELVPCKRGLHLCRLEHLVKWLGPQIWLAEYDGELIECDDKVVVRRARITEQTAWNETSARLFAADCAERVLPIFEAAYPNDDRPRRAIEAARAYARGEIGDAERAAAWTAASDAWAAAWAAASDAARAAASAAASDAWAAASAAARAAAWTAASDASDAASDAARAAAWAPAWDAAWAPAWDTERRWQTERLGEYLEGPFVGDLDLGAREVGE